MPRLQQYFVLRLSDYDVIMNYELLLKTFDPIMFCSLSAKVQMWRNASRDDQAMYIVVFLNSEFHKNNPKCAQSIVKRIRDEGHCITLFGK